MQIESIILLQIKNAHVMIIFEIKANTLIKFEISKTFLFQHMNINNSIIMNSENKKIYIYVHIQQRIIPARRLKPIKISLLGPIATPKQFCSSIFPTD